jgi:hypothetical protein
MISLKFRRHNDTPKQTNTQTHTQNFNMFESQGFSYTFFTLPVGVKAELLKEQSNGTKIAAPGLLCAPLTGLAKISI